MSEEIISNEVDTTVEEFVKYVEELSTKVGADEFLFFEDKISNLTQLGYLDYIDDHVPSCLILAYGDIVEVNNQSVYKAWYVDSRRIINNRPLVLYTTQDYIESIAGVGNYKLKILMYRLLHEFNKHVPSIEIRLIEDQEIIKKVISYDKAIPAVHNIIK